MILKKIISNKEFLFLDRDGVINKRKVDDYITCWDDFEFLPGVMDALKVFAKYFQRVIIITNQQGLGKEIMTEEQLNNIHRKLKESVNQQGGRIDAIYFCPMLRNEKNNCRKPSAFMANQAQMQFPEITFDNSIMIGDTATDMEFGKNTGMSRILLENEHTTDHDREWAEASITNLTELSNLLK